MSKAVIKSLLSVGPIGMLASRCSHRLASPSMHSRIAHISGYTPQAFTFTVHTARGRSRLRMVHQADDGLRDPVARKVWRAGWKSFEAPLPAIWTAAAGAGSPDAVALDIGANSGLYSLLAAAGGASRIHAFEPLPSAMNFFKANIEASGLRDHIVAEPLAVGDKPGAATLYIPHQPPGFDLLESSASLNAGFRDSHDEAIEVEVVTIDYYLAKRDIKDVSIVKIDVESCERIVLAGMQETLRSRRPLVFLEVLSDDVAEAVREVCRTHNYIAWSMEPDRLLRSTYESTLSDRNMALCPAEREDELRSLAAEAGLGVE